MKAEFGATAAGLLRMQELGNYAEVKELESGVKTPGKGPGKMPFLWSRHSYRQTEASGFPGARISETYLRVSHGRFVKIRITTKQENLARDQPVIDRFMAELAGLLAGMK